MNETLNAKASIGAGHNSSIVGDGLLLQFVERIERLETDKSAVSEEIRELYSESKSVGFDPKILRKVIAIRKEDAEKREQREEMIELYLQQIARES